MVVNMIAGRSFRGGVVGEFFSSGCRMLDRDSFDLDLTRIGFSSTLNRMRGFVRAEGGWFVTGRSLAGGSWRRTWFGG